MDSDKILSIKNGSHEDFTETYQALLPKVFRFFLKRVALHETAKDLTQQCFIRLWEYRHTLSVHHPFEKQLFIIARSLLNNHIKKEIYLKNGLHHYSQQANSPETANSLSFFETSQHLHESLHHLPPIRKKIIGLKLVEGYSNKEIAEQLSISLKTVENHINKAYHVLKKIHGKAFIYFIIVLLK